MIDVDGSQKSGSGTILRLSIALAAILNEPLHIYNIRKKRPQPGLKPQHLEAVLTAARICKATVEGAKLGSRELWFYPSEIVGGKIKAKIGTAGSIPMLLITILPMCSFAKNPAHIHVSKGGTDVHHSPTINYLKHVFLRILRGMALETSLQVHKYGYYPKGMGEVSVSIQPNPKLSPLCCEEREHISLIEGVSVCTFLADRKVAWRQAKAAEQFLEKHGYKTNIKIVNDRSNPLQKGSSLTLWASSDSVFLGGDAIGELRKTSENVGKEAAENLIAELDAEATVDSHLADMIIPYIALSDADSVFLTRKISDHLETNIWLAQRILDTEFKISRIGNLYRVEKKTS